MTFRECIGLRVINTSIKMEPLFEISVDDINDLLPHMKRRLMSGSENAQGWVIEQISTFLKRASVSDKNVIVKKLVRSDVMSAICDVMETSDENFVKIVLECLELASVCKEFYENHAAMSALKSTIRLSYCVNKSLKDSTLFEQLLQTTCNILVRSSELAVDIDSVCDVQQIILYLKDLDVEVLQKNKLKFTTVTMLNVILQRTAFDESIDEEAIIDVCGKALASMAEVIKYDDDDKTISLAASILCGTCAGASRFCIGDYEGGSQSDDKLKIHQKKIDLSICIYDMTITIVIPYVKDADLSGVNSIKFHRNLVSCLNNLYQLSNCNHDDLSNHLAANGYLKYFLYFTVQIPENLRRSICALLSRVLSVLGKATFSEDTAEFAHVLRQGLLELPKSSIEQWDVAVTHCRKDGMALMILLYYHFHGTGQNDMVSLQSLIARIMLLPISQPISVTILKPLWFLFAATSISHLCPYSIHQYENAVVRLTNLLQGSEISEFYTHHIDLLHYCLICPDIPQSFMNQVLDLWLIESDGDIKPLLAFNCDKVLHRLLIVLQTGYPQRIMNLAVRGLRYLIEIGKGAKHSEQIADIIWHMLPKILSSYQSNTVAHIEVVLELANITQPQTIPIHLIIHSADSIVNIVVKKNADSKFMNLVITQAYILLVAAMSRQSIKVLEAYIKKHALLKELYIYGFSQERSELSAISIKLLAFIVHCQSRSSIQCKDPLTVDIKSLTHLLIYARKSPCCVMNGMQFVYEVLTQDIDGSAVVLRKIVNDTNSISMVINLYEMLHMVHIQRDPVERDTVYQCLVAVLHFCDKVIKAPELVPHLCTLMNNYDLIVNVVNMRYVSYHFVEFVITWLHYRKMHCNDTLWNNRSLPKSPFDEALDHLKEYLLFVCNKGLEDVSIKLRYALSQFEVNSSRNE